MVKEITREKPFECELEKVIADGEDITEKVKELEQQECHKVVNDKFPF